MNRRFSTIDVAVDTIAKGGAIIVLDSEDRENEGDFLACAETIDAQTIHMMVTEGRGQLCMPILPDVAERLKLNAMVEDADLQLPRFTVPVDHCRCTTGISPAERADSIRAIVDPSSAAEDFIRPGHTFPLIARAGGLSERIGHTESAVELAAMAGLHPSGVLCEICSRDGLNMALRDELLELADRLEIPIVTIDALLEYRGLEDGTEKALLETVADLQQVAASPVADAAARDVTLCCPMHAGEQ